MRRSSVLRLAFAVMAAVSCTMLTGGEAHATSAAAPSTYATLYGDTCITTTDCVAVGFWGDSPISKAQTTLAESWNGAKWTVQTTTNPGGASDSYLRSVACPSAKECLAVGFYYPAVGFATPFWEEWNGTKWLAAQAFPLPAGAETSFLYSISCPSATACVAVGTVVFGSGDEQALAGVWNGSKWTLTSAKNPSATANAFLAVSCFAASSCTAVGEQETSAKPVAWATLAEHWSGSAWSAQSPQNVAGASNELGGVSCAASECMAVGYDYATASVFKNLAEEWTGTKWVMVTVADPSATNNLLQASACVAPFYCQAVGWQHNTSAKTVTEAVGGSSTLANEATPANGAVAYSFYGVACKAKTSCVAVGSSQANTASPEPGGAAVGESWNGTKWTAALMPTP